MYIAARTKFFELQEKLLALFEIMLALIAAPSVTDNLCIGSIKAWSIFFRQAPSGQRGKIRNTPISMHMFLGTISWKACFKTASNGIWSVLPINGTDVGSGDLMFLRYWGFCFLRALSSLFV